MFWIESFITDKIKKEIESLNETKPPLILAHIVPWIYVHFYESNIIVVKQYNVDEKFYSLESSAEDICKRISY